MGVGEPDEMAFPDCVDALAKAAAKPANRTYADNGGRSSSRKPPRSSGCKSVCNVSEPRSRQKRCPFTSAPRPLCRFFRACLINPGDVALMTTPGYPVFGTHSQYYGGEVFNLPLLEKNQFLPDLASIPADKLRRAKTLVINYPNNPTGASATPEFFASVVAFAKKHNLVVIHDAAYAALVFEGKPLSFLATPGAIDVGIELHSMSKGFNMTGWRLGFVVGNPLLVRAYADVKDNTDSGQFLAIQEACAYTLDHPEITQKIAVKYSRRMDGLVAVLKRHGFPPAKSLKAPSSSTSNASAQLPPSAQRWQTCHLQERAENFSQWMITEKLISTVPWDDAGAYVRFSVTFSAKGQADEERVLAEIDRRLTGAAFEVSVPLASPPVEFRYSWDVGWYPIRNRRAQRRLLNLIQSRRSSLPPKTHHIPRCRPIAAGLRFPLQHQRMRNPTSDHRLSCLSAAISAIAKRISSARPQSSGRQRRHRNRPPRLIPHQETPRRRRRAPDAPTFHQRRRRNQNLARLPRPSFTAPMKSKPNSAVSAAINGNPASSTSISSSTATSSSAARNLSFPTP